MSKKIYYNDGEDEMYNKSRNEAIANSLENFIDTYEELLIPPEGTSVEENKKAIKIVKKAIKNLRKGHPEKVFDKDRFDEYIFGENQGDVY